ncbi:hypothetical protein P7C70_g3063, partial [Phenoliferia sp. Uapishka_3]
MASPDFLGWNGVQEADIARWYDRPFQRDLPGQLQWMDTHDEPLSPSAYQKALELIRTRVDCARKWQVTLGRALVDNACLGRKTEKQWLALGSARQREMMEVTLDTICRRKDIRRIRFDVPEIRMAELLERGGQGFVDLAERCVAPSGSRQEVHWVENKRYDQLVGTPARARNKAQRVWVEKSQANRHFFLFLFVSRVWAWLDGVTPDDIARNAATRNRSPNFCASCAKPEVAGGPKMLCCAQCKRLDLQAGTLSFVIKPPPISSALQRQLDALEINPLAFYQVFGKDDLPAGRSINLEYSEDPVPTPDILRRFAIRYRYPKLIATILIAVRLHISDTELPMFEAQLLEEFEITLADLRQGELDCAAPSQFPTTLR